MRCQLAVSNIGFPPAALSDALTLMRELGIEALEVAPLNVFGRWDVETGEVDALRARLDAMGMRCPALQGIAFNVGAAHLFASEESRRALYEHLALIARMAGRLGAAACVFGAPKLRDAGDLSPQAARAIAVGFLRRIGPVFANEGSCLAFEPNARCYACNFITTTSEALDLLAEVASPGVALQIDTGTVFLESEDPEILSAAAKYAAHAHISEPDLAPIGTSGVEHAPLARALHDGGYTGSLSIEMKSVPEWHSAITRAVTIAREIYV